MQRAFLEDWVGDLDPVDGRTADFDWPRVFADLDGEKPPELDERAVEAIRRLLLWVAGDGVRRRDWLNVAGRRALALVWVLDPSLLGGESLATIAERLGVTRASLSFYAAEAARVFGVKNRSQPSG